MSADTSLDQVLARHRVGITGAELVAELDSELSHVTSAAARPLSVTDIEFLRAHGGPHAGQILTDSSENAAQSAAQATTRQLARTIAESVSIPEAARLLDVDRSRVSQLISTHRLWAFQLSRAKRLPRWQFTAAGRLPGLDDVVPAIPEGMTPQSIAGFMATPQDDLNDTSPVEWLAAGGAPTEVARLMADLGRW